MIVQIQTALTYTMKFTEDEHAQLLQIVNRNKTSVESEIGFMIETGINESSEDDSEGD